MIGRIIDNYKIVSELGRGGMGIVYKAYDTKLDRYVAIKILKEEITTRPHFIERFKKEAKNQAQLSHPNIVPVFGFIEQEGMLGIVMEYVEGESLEHFIERAGRINVFDAISIYKQVLSGSGYAHSKGFIHRDIKPSNIIIASDGVAKIMDFGISRSLFEKGNTRDGAQVGTLLYMSPEQVKGDEIYVQSDIYSLGITLYEMLTGYTPFAFENEFEIIEGHLKQQPPSLISYYPELPQNLEWIIFKALAKNPFDRYGSDEEFLRDLVALEDELIKFHKAVAPGIEELRKPGKAKSLIISGVILLIIISFMYLVMKLVINVWENDKEKTILDTKREQKAAASPVSGNSRINWSVIPSGVNQQLNSICFKDDSTGYSCGEKGLLLKTIDGGRHWVKTDLPFTHDFLDIYFNYEGDGFLAGDKGILLKSTDNGSSWEPLDLRYKDSFFKVKFISHSVGFISGSNGTILKTTDNGKEWYRVRTETSEIIYNYEFIDAHNGYAVTKGGELLRTSDGGEVWTKKKKISESYLKSIAFISPSTGFITSGEGAIFKTSDGGRSWQQVGASFDFPLYDIQFIDEKSGFVLGARGKVIFTQDGGESWKAADLNTYASLNDLTLAPAKRLYAAGVNGTIMKF